MLPTSRISSSSQVATHGDEHRPPRDPAADTAQECEAARARAARRDEGQGRSRHGAASATPVAAATGNESVAVMPRGELPASLRLAAGPNMAASRARMLARPVPPPEVPSPKPRPVSATATCSSDESLLALTRTRPPSGSGLSPCLSAFSTRVRQHHRRNFQAAQLGRDVDLERETAAHPDLLHVEERFDQGRLAFQGRRFVAHARQRHLQVTHQVVEHLPTERRVRLVQATHVGQGVEEEMRLDLRLQDLQPRRGHLAVERQPVHLGVVHRRRRCSLRSDRTRPR